MDTNVLFINSNMRLALDAAKLAWVEDLRLKVRMIPRLLSEVDFLIVVWVSVWKSVK